MEYKDKAKLIIQFTEQSFYDDQYADFFDYNDLGVPVSVALFNDLVTLTSEGEKLINETYSELCGIFNADENEDYENLDELIGE